MADTNLHKGMDYCRAKHMTDTNLITGIHLDETSTAAENRRKGRQRGQTQQTWPTRASAHLASGIPGPLHLADTILQTGVDEDATDSGHQLPHTGMDYCRVKHMTDTNLVTGIHLDETPTAAENWREGRPRGQRGHTQQTWPTRTSAHLASGIPGLCVGNHSTTTNHATQDTEDILGTTGRAVTLPLPL